jgi:cytochrome c oxidase subunit I
MESALHEQTEGRHLVAAWLLLALAALALSTLCAVLLVAARAPLPGGLAASGELFGRALVLHVSFAVIVWFLSCAAGFWTLAAGGRATPARWVAVALACIGLGGMVLPLFSAAARPVLANYVPVLDHPVFLAGLVLFISGVALSGAAAIRDVMRRLKEGPVWRLGALLSILAAVFALGALIASFAQAGTPAGPDGFEILAWGPGHLLQFVHVLLLMSVWTELGASVLGEPVAPRRWLVVLLLLGAAPLLAAPFIYLGYPVDSAGFRRAFTLLMAWGAWPAAVVLALRILLQLVRARQSVRRAPDTAALLLSMLLFLLGCVLGALIRAESTMVPAHYHGTVGAVTLAYMALGYRLLPAFGARGNADALRRWQPVLYGAGLMVLALALAWSGWLGVPRKTLHVDVIVQYPAYFAAMGLVGLGGLLAIVGAGLFVLNVVRSLRVAINQSTPRGRRDVRLQALVITLVLTVSTGVLIAYWPNELGTVTSNASAAPGKHKEEVARKFAEGVELLNARQYQAAASAMHRVLELAPEMPEAHVNMGFAMIGLQKHAIARDFFEAALNLRANQMNAYYGLAIALEATGDIEGAIGAMRTYTHLSDPNDPFVRKANAALWEWQEQIAKARQAKQESPAPVAAAIPESGNAAIRYPITEKKIN